jgi:hypothetical protein
MARETHRRSEISLTYGIIIIKELGGLSLLGGFDLHGHYAKLYFEKTRDSIANHAQSQKVYRAIHCPRDLLFIDNTRKVTFPCDSFGVP